MAVVELTEDNDVNNLIGRPGQYDAATFLAEKRLGGWSDDGWNELGVDCGADYVDAFAAGHVNRLCPIAGVTTRRIEAP